MRFGYPVAVAAGLVGVIQQIQRWLPWYELIDPHQLPYLVAGSNLATLLVGSVGVFVVGIRADRQLHHQWTLSAAVRIGLIGGVAGLGVGTALAFLLQPAQNTVTIRPLISFLWPLAVYTLAQGVPVGLAAVAGLAGSRIRAIERTETAFGSE